MLKAIANTFSNCFKIPELKSRIFFTLIVLGVCRLISVIPIPALDGAVAHCPDVTALPNSRPNSLDDIPRAAVQRHRVLLRVGEVIPVSSEP